MCFSSPDIPDMPPPPPPPPPAPNVSATKVKAPTVTRSDRANRAATGLAKYRVKRSTGGTLQKGVNRGEATASKSMGIY